MKKYFRFIFKKLLMPYNFDNFRKLISNLPETQKVIFLLIVTIGSVIILAIKLQHIDSIKSMVTPGPVITPHAKYEKDCAKCHHAIKKRSQNDLCLDCHKDVAEDLKHQKRFHGGSGSVKEKQCKSCHTDHKGRAFDIVHLDKETFNHNLTDFALAEAHARASITCEACHAQSKKYRSAPKDCLSCHMNNDKHKGQLGKDCAACHRQTFWKDTYFDHRKTHFPLKGKHQQAACNACHANETYKNTPIDCISCHLVNDIHATPSGQHCELCHGVREWKEISYDHNLKTKFVLKERHAELKCAACHPGNLYFDGYGVKNAVIRRRINQPSLNITLNEAPDFQAGNKQKGIFNNARSDALCVDCHNTDDIHKGKNGAKCDSCHSSVNWKQITFDHNRDSKYKLLGRHTGLKCAACHTDKSGKMKIGTDCYSCHRKDDMHKSRQGTKCELCHNENAWEENIKFDHDLTDFPLIGLHAVTSCGECHLTSAFKEADTACISCHRQNDYHKAALGTNCAKCHNPNGWKLWEFDHNTQTKYKLEGAHEGLECQSCHQTPMGKDVQISNSCFSCHDNDDAHRGQFGQQCDRCHTVESFKKILWEDN